MSIIFHNFDIKSMIFSQFWPGALYPKLLDKALLLVYMTDLQKSRLMKQFNEYDEELEIIKEEFDTERSIMVDQHNTEMNDIADILFAMEQNFQEKENEAKSEFQSMRDEIKNKVYFYLRRFRESRSSSGSTPSVRLSVRPCY